MAESTQKRITRLTRELGRNPFFPLLFIGEGVKQTVYHVVGGRPSLPILFASWVMAVLSLTAWLFFYEEIQWGINAATE